MKREEDPEVVADAELRAATERDPTRARSPLSALGFVWAKPADVATWSCRFAKCAKPVGVTQDAVDALAVSNRLLTARGESEIPTSGVVICAECLVGLARFEADRNADRKRDIARHIATLKASTDPSREHAAVAGLRKARHPEADIVALLRHLGEKLNSSPGKGRRGNL